MFYTLPKIWQGRIKKYWDKTIPGDFPASKAKFDLKFDTEEEKEAVAKFEAELGTEESIVNELIPEGTFMSGYLGIYDVNGPRDEKVLLNPEKVTADDPFIVLHYEDEEWNVLEDTELIEGYIWGIVPTPTDEEQSGTVTPPPGPAEEDSFSPIAVVFYKKDIEVATLDWFNGKIAVANGNPVDIITDEEDHVVMVNKSSGNIIDLTKEGISYITAGTVDGSSLKSASISVSNVDKVIRIFAGSMYYNAEEVKSAKIDNADVVVYNSNINGITGGVGYSRIENLNVKLVGSKFMFTAAGQTTLSKIGKDANTSLEDISINSPEWVKNVKFDIDNCEIQWLYTGGHSGYTYTINAECNISNSKVTGGIAAGGSNGRSDEVKFNIVNTETPSYISSNRGILHNVSSKFKDSKITELAIFSKVSEDATAKITESVAIDIDRGTYGIIVGKNDDKLVTSNELVKYVKISRSADYTISDADLNLLGDKFIVK